MNNEKANIGLFFDGYFFYKLYKYFFIEKRLAFNFEQFNEFIKQEVQHQFDIVPSQCDEINPNNIHLFIGGDGTSETEPEKQLKRSLTALRIQLHNSPLQIRNDTESFLQEKGVDVSLTIRAVEDALDKKYNTLVLITGDADFVPLVNWSKQRNINVLGVYWSNSDTNTKASQDFIDSLTGKVDLLSRLEDKSNRLIKVLFDEIAISDENMSTIPASKIAAWRFSGERPPQTLTQKQLDEVRESVILNLNHQYGSGFIRSEQFYPDNKKWNNYRFSLSDVEGRKADEVAAGMRVQFNLEYDGPRSAKEGVTLYRATNVIIID
ncbi:MAG: NYN domain-containing protein [Spirochaetaceae bacterium]|jgi:uncharacterized LabA/DUF88 family protein|nr:NYN domain-containing protein [Spirochaetaceae bacterium]